MPEGRACPSCASRSGRRRCATTSRPGCGTMLRQAKELGVTPRLDDFGTGSSVDQVGADLPPDVLKIDREFVKGLGMAAEDTAIVQMMTASAGRARHGHRGRGDRDHPAARGPAPPGLRGARATCSATRCPAGDRGYMLYDIATTRAQPMVPSTTNPPQASRRPARPRCCSLEGIQPAPHWPARRAPLPRSPPTPPPRARERDRGRRRGRRRRAAARSARRSRGPCRSLGAPADAPPAGAIHPTPRPWAPAAAPHVAPPPRRRPRHGTVVPWSAEAPAAPLRASPAAAAGLHRVSRAWAGRHRSMPASSAWR